MQNTSKNYIWRLIILILHLQSNVSPEEPKLSICYNFYRTLTFPVKCIKNHLHAMVFDERIALKNTLILLALWSIPYSINLLRHTLKINRIKKRLSIKESPTDELIRAIVNQQFTQNITGIRNAVYDELDRRQFLDERVGESRSPGIQGLSNIVSDYLQEDDVKEREIRGLQRDLLYTPVPVRNNFLICWTNASAIYTYYLAIWYYCRLILAGTAVIICASEHDRLEGIYSLAAIHSLMRIRKRHILLIQSHDRYKDLGKYLFASASYLAALIAMDNLALKRLN